MNFKGTPVNFRTWAQERKREEKKKRERKGNVRKEKKGKERKEGRKRERNRRKSLLGWKKSKKERKSGSEWLTESVSAGGRGERNPQKGLGTSEQGTWASSPHQESCKDMVPRRADAHTRGYRRPGRTERETSPDKPPRPPPSPGFLSCQNHTRSC